jgi:hypothetical protein
MRCSALISVQEDLDGEEVTDFEDMRRRIKKTMMCTSTVPGVLRGSLHHDMVQAGVSNFV